MKRNTSDEFDDQNEMNLEDERHPTTPKIPGNTLDYYNEDLTRNAVQGLFSESPKKGGRGAFVSGYDDEELYAPSAKRKPRQTPAFEDEEKPVMRQRDREPRQPTFVSERKREEKERVRQPEEAREPVGMEGSEDGDYGRYRMKDRVKEPTSEKADAGYTGASRPSSRGVTPAIQVNDRGERRAPYTTFKKEPYRAIPPQSAPVGEDAGESHDDAVPFVRIVAIAASVVVLIIFATLIFKINSTNKKLTEATEALAKYTEENDINTMKMDYEQLETDYRNLTAEFETYKTANPPGPEPESEEADTQPNSSAQTASRTHVVQAGESLSKISQQYYGTSSEYTKIMEANGITDPSKLAVGTKIVIP